MMAFAILCRCDPDGMGEVQIYSTQTEDTFHNRWETVRSHTYPGVNGMLTFYSHHSAFFNGDMLALSLYSNGRGD